LPFWNRRRTDAPKPAELIEALEDRLVLYSNPFLANLPDLSLMKNNQDTVVRMQTSEGVIDIELYDVGGPPAHVTADNFLNYVRSGRYDNTFFHRLVTGFVLQGGGFSLKDPLPADTVTPKYDSVVTDPPIVNEFSAARSNLARTIAMAKLGSDPNSANSQFFFNLVDNSSNLDNQNGGFTVFGKVIAGWDVVTTISALQTRNLNTYLAGSSSAAFDTVPIQGTNNSDVVTIVDVEVIKRKNQTAYFLDNSAYFPDAFRNGRGSATISLVNPDATPGAGAQYQIIARFESGTRDKVIAEGFLFAGAHIDIPVYKGGDPTVNRVRGGTPFGYEVRYTRAIAVSVNGSDFGATYGSSFIATAGLSAANLEAWSFGNGQKGTGLASYVEYMNLTGQTANVTVTFYPEAGTPFTLVKAVEPLRRAGLDAGQILSIPDGLFSISITSDQPVVAALTQFRFAPARASTETGQITGLTLQGVAPGVTIPSVGQTTVSVLYTGSSPTTITIDFEFILADGTILTNNSPFTLTTTVRRRVLDLSIANAGLPRNQPFAVRYHVHNDDAPVSAAITSIIGGNTTTTAFQTYSSQSVYFADGFTDPSVTTNNETISLVNPFRTAGFTMNYTIKFNFVNAAGGNVVIPAAGTGMLAANQMVTIRTRDLTEVMAKIQAGTQFRHYSISIETTFSHNGTPVDGAVFAQLQRTDTAGGNTITTGPSFATTGPAFFFTDPTFTQT
jgi:cyclophilin family peptidyl-prolyl cis-trans isomerase